MSTIDVIGGGRLYADVPMGGIDYFPEFVRTDAHAGEHETGLVTVSCSAAAGDDYHGYGFEFDVTPDGARALAAQLIEQAGVIDGPTSD